jgi:tRNA(Ile)-lysidine synthase
VLVERASVFDHFPPGAGLSLGQSEEFSVGFDEEKQRVDEQGDRRSRGFLEQLAEGWRPHSHVKGPVVVAVSGGGDSVALLRGLHQLLTKASPSSQRLIVAHAQHDLREGQHGEPAAADAAFVRGLAESLGLQSVSRVVRVRETVRGGEGLEAAARRLRYAFLCETAELLGARLVVTAHTSDDQVETVLHRLLRGTGLGGLAGMAAARPLVEGIALVRPMLGVSASAARDYLRAIGQSWQEDASNADTRYARNLLRHEMLPRLAAGPYPGVREAVLRLAYQARQTHEMAEAAGEALLAAYASREPSGSVLVRAAPLATCPPSLLTDLVATLWRQQGWPRRDMTSRHYAAVASLLSRASGSSPPSVDKSIDLPGGIRARRVAGGGVRIGPAEIRPHPDLPHRR